MADGQGFNVEGLLADPLFNTGLGLLAASGPSTMPTNLGQALAQGVQFASQRQREAAQNEIARQRLVQAQQQREAQARLAQRLPGLLSNLPPEQREAVGLLADVAPAQVAQGLLANILPEQRSETSLVRNLRAAGIDPAGEEGRKIIIDNLKQSGGTSAQLDQILKAMQIQKLQREEATEQRTEAVSQSAEKTSVLKIIKQLNEAADINDRLESTFAETGTGFEDISRLGVGGGAALTRALGLGGEAQGRTAADFDRLRKLSSELIVQEAQKTKGQATDNLRTFIEQSTFGTGVAPGANRLVIADTLEQGLAAADRVGANVPDRAGVEARIRQLRGDVERQPSAVSEPAPAAAQPAADERQTGQRTERDILRRASEVAGRAITEADVRDTMRKRGLTRRQVLEFLESRLQPTAPGTQSRIIDFNDLPQ